MNGFLLDTMVVSEGTKRRPNSKVASWLGKHSADSCYLSVLTIGEIQHGIARLPAASPRRTELTRWLHHTLLPEFRSRIVPFDLDVALAWGEVVAAASARGMPLPTIDAQIGATSKAHNLTLVTRNTRHYAEIGIDLVDPWG
jgi:toxin FitB